jgi:hypothetical protein
MVENIPAQNSPLLIDEQKTDLERAPEKEQIKFHGLRETPVSVETH